MQFYLNLDNIIMVCNNFPKVIITKDETNPSVAKFDVNTKITTINLHSDSRIADFPSYFHSKKQDIEEIIDIPEGSYDLLAPVIINDFVFIRSSITWGKSFNQYVLDPALEQPNQCFMRKDTITVIVNEGITPEAYIQLINNNNLGLYILEAREKPIITTCYGIILDKAVNVNIYKKTVNIIKDVPILIEEADYITALVLKLKETYPEIQFYNCDSDFNDTKYNEFVRYSATMGTFNNEQITTPVFDDPIYGQVIRTTCKFNFEYHTADIVTYNRRRFEFQINKFLSNLTSCELPFPLTDRKLLFSVHWDRAKLINNTEYVKQTKANTDKKTQYIFDSSASLTVTIFRIASSYHVIRQILLQNNVGNQQQNFSYSDTSQKWQQLS
jgi:hypothetical protein